MKDISQQQNNPVSKPKCLGYARVSSFGQRDNLSIDVQQLKIVEKIREIGGQLAEPIYVDNGFSGTSIEHRLAFQELLTRCAKGDITFIIAQDSSRIARNTLEYLLIKKELEKYNAKIIPLTGFANLDNNPMSETSDEMLAVFNSFHSRMTSYKVRQTATEKFKQGFYPSLAPMGYKNINNSIPKGPYDKKIVAPNPAIAPLITQVFKLYATNEHSIFSIKQYLHKNGIRSSSGRPLYDSVVHGILKNSFYYGLMHWGGLTGLGKHTPLIDKKTFDKIQQILFRKSDYGIRTRKHNFLLRGVIFCINCGRRYVAEWHVDPKFKSRGGRIGYYHCSGVGKRGTGCQEKYIQIEDLESRVEREVEKLQFDDQFIEAVKRNVEKVYTNTVGRINLAKKALHNRKTTLEIKREKLEEELLSETLSRERFKALNSKVEEDLLNIQKELLEIDNTKRVDPNVINQVLEFTQQIVDGYKKADINSKRAYLRYFFERIEVKNKKIVNIQYTPILQALNKTRLGILDSVMLPRRDSNAQPYS